MASNIRRAIEAVQGGEELTPHDQLLIANEVMQLRVEVWALKVELDTLSRFIENAKYLGEVDYGKGSAIDDIVKKRVM